MDEVTRLKETNAKLSTQNKTLILAIEDLNKQVTQLKDSEKRLMEDNRTLTEELVELLESSICKDVEHNKEQNKLKVALSNMETKMRECVEAHQREKKLMKANKILSLKIAERERYHLHRQRLWVDQEAAIYFKAKKQIKRNCLELDARLNTASDKMKEFYNDLMIKTKEKHESELQAVRREVVMLCDEYDEHVDDMNQQQLELQRENSCLKNYLRQMKKNAHESRLTAQLFSSTLKMEDEVGEIFDQMYLSDSKVSVPSSSTAPEAIRLPGIQQRNSLSPRHLPSGTYAAQHGDQNLKKQDTKVSSSKRRTT